MNNTGFNLYLVFVCSWFLHLTSRITFLGSIRFDLLLVIILTLLALSREENNINNKNDISRYLKIIILFCLLTIPFVEWPGSVIKFGLPNFIKAGVFFYFTVRFVTNINRLNKIVIVFIGCQLFRVIEPLYLHITEGYWGDLASMSGWEYMYRLSGAPKDIINPNGLAFVILTTIPFLHFYSCLGKLYKFVYLAALPLLLYALMLTGSRSGMIGLIMVLAGIVYMSKHKVTILTLAMLGGIIIYSGMSDNQKDRYLSIVNSDTKNAVTAEGRIEGVQKDLALALRRPFFGHGLGTSKEAKANYGGEDKLSHNLYTEIALEIGFVGLILYVIFIKSIIDEFRKNIELFKNQTLDAKLIAANNSLIIWLSMNIIFSFASYGLSSYEWYLFAGMTVALRKQVETDIKN